MSDYSNIANYLFKKDIGEGNFGKVKLGIFKQTGEEFAIKILNKKKIKIKMKNTVFKENEIITKFNHVNVIFVFNIIEDKDNYYIVMEYCKSGELFDYIVERQHLEEDEASIFFYQLINGVEYIHSLGVAHRDLKPENLLLTGNKVLKIIDFGLSHEFNGEDLLKTKCGSPSYAAPEIIKGLPYDGFKTDIWCCGIILYAMVCGYLPFEGGNNKILFKNIVECNPEIPDYLTEETQDLISRILREEPDDRITIDEIKTHDFYLRGKELCDIDYPKLQRMLNKKRQNMSKNSFSNIDKGIDDIEFINQKINITIDNEENEKIDDVLKIENSNNNISKKDKENTEDILIKVDDNDNDIVIKSVNEISSSKMTNNSKHENNIINKEKEKSIKKLKIYEEEKNEEPRRHFKFNNKKSALNAFRDKIFAINKNFNKKIENFNNNMNLILKTDANVIVNNKLNQNPIYNNKFINTNKNKNDFENNTNNINTISSTINGNQKNTYMNSIYTNNNALNTNDINSIMTNEKKAILLDNISLNSKTKKLKIQENNKNKIPQKKFKENNFTIFANLQNNKKKTDNKYNITLNGLNRRIKKSDNKNDVIKLNNNLNFFNKGINHNNKNNINIINNINNTINNYGTLNILSTINSNNNNNNFLNSKSNKKKSSNEKLKTEGNTFNVIKEMILNNKRRVNSSYKNPKVNQNHQNRYLNNLTKDYHSTKSSNSGSTKNNKSNNGSNSKSYKNKKIKNSSNIIGNLHNKGYIVKTSRPPSHNNIMTKVNNNNKYIQYPALNIGNKLFLEKKSKNGMIVNNINYINNKNYISNSGNNSKRNKPVVKRNNINKKNEINDSNEKNNKKEYINYFNAISTMFMKTENNLHKNKFKNSNTNSVNSRISKNSKNSKATSKNSKSTKSSKSSKKKYNLIRHAIKNQMGNFIFNKKGGSEGKTSRFIQHSKLFNINAFKNNNIHNINNLLDNCVGINNNINENNKKGNMENNIKIIKQKGNRGKKVIYNQINFKNFYNFGKNKKNFPYLANNY